MKVIHAVDRMHREAVENWLVRMFLYGRRCGLELDWTFYCELPDKGVLEDEVRSLGGKIVHSPVPLAAKLPFMKAFRQTLESGGYDVLHCHHDLISAMYLVASIGLPIRRRLVHVHNADGDVRTNNRWKQFCLRPILRQICLSLADRVVGISQHTLDAFIHGRPRRLGRDVVHYYGVDPTRFVSASGDRAGFRRGLDFPEDALVLLFAGRIVPEKNPRFAVEVLAELRRLNSQVVGVFLGDGSLRSATIESAQRLGIAQQCRFLGWSDDVPEIMACCDWFILPRPEQPMEGLGLAVIEAQLAGLRLLLSRGIADDPLLPTACVTRLTLAAGPEAWARAALDILAQPKPSRKTAANALAHSPFDMHFALRDLLQLLGGETDCKSG